MKSSNEYALVDLQKRAISIGLEKKPVAVKIVPAFKLARQEIMYKKVAKTSSCL